MTLPPELAALNSERLQSRLKQFARLIGGDPEVRVTPLTQQSARQQAARRCVLRASPCAFAAKSMAGGNFHATLSLRF